MNKQGVVNIRGKQYKTVALRVNEFRDQFGNLSIQTELVSSGDMVVVKALIVDENDNVRATGYAEEVRGSSNINKTSALENCETSAIGRALACFGLAGEEYASANEVSDAIIQQEVMNAMESFHNYQKVMRDNYCDVSEVKVFLGNDSIKLAVDSWFGIDREDRRLILSLPPTKGGLLTTKERDTIINHDLFRAEYAKTSKDRVE